MPHKLSAGLTTIFDLIIIDAKKKPPFLNTTNEDHKKVRNIISALLIEITNLIKPYFIPDKDLFDTLTSFETIAAEFCLITNVALYLNANLYIERLIKKYIDEAIREQEYESAANLKNFMSLREQYEQL